MFKRSFFLTLTLLAGTFVAAAQQQSITIAVANNPDVIRLKKLSIGSEVGQNLSAAFAGKMTVDQALQASQSEAERAVRQAGYLK